MIISAAFFFFVSVFGMVCSFQSKKEYLKSFIVSKCGYLLSIATITYLISIGIALLVPVDIGYWKGIDFFIYNFFCGNQLVYMGIDTILFKMGWPEKWCSSALAFTFGVLSGNNPINY